MSYERILITGASGFIGSRLCEKLTLQYRLPYRALVRNYSRAARIARLAPEMVAGDLTDPAALDAALSGCDAVVHLAFVEKENVEDNLLAACRRARIKRFVHISSMAVHGPQPGPECAREETATIRHYNQDYSDAKARAEKKVQRAIAHGLPGVILRPTIVYGPYGPFVVRVIESAREGAVTLIDDGLGICNAVYVDDVCDAIYAALHTETGLGKAFFINGDRAVSWRDFNLTFAKMVSPEIEIRSVSAREVRAYWEAGKPSLRSNISAMKRLLSSEDFQDQLATVPALRSAIRWSKGRLKKILSADRVIALQYAGAGPLASAESTSWPDMGRIVREDFHLEFSNALAKQLLDWKPAFDFPAGAAMTKTWLEFADMLGRPA
ncbi:MAG: NAD-dependent epimerase/dehydratase family protein [Stellaceae bacterium]